MAEEKNNSAANDGNHGGHHVGKTSKTSSSYSSKHVRTGIFTCITILLLLIGVTALVLYLIYRPSSPQYTIAAVSIAALNATTPPLLTTNMHFTIVTRNPNKRVSIYYDRISVFVVYRNQAITPPTFLPPFHQRRRSTVAMEVAVGGVAPVSVEVVDGLGADEEYGAVGMRVVVLGRIRWKVFWGIKTGHNGVYVKCDFMVGLRKGFVGADGLVPLLGTPICNVDV